MLWRQADQWKTRPSEILGIEDPLLAFSIDQCVWSFGSALRDAMNQAGRKAKTDQAKDKARERVIRKWLPTSKADTAAYRDPSKEMPEGGRKATSG